MPGHLRYLPGRLAVSATCRKANRALGSLTDPGGLVDIYPNGHTLPHSHVDAHAHLDSKPNADVHASAHPYAGAHPGPAIRGESA